MRLYERGYVKLEKEMDLAKIIRNVRRAKFLIGSKVADPLSKIRMFNSKKFVIEIDNSQGE